MKVLRPEKGTQITLYIKI